MLEFTKWKIDHKITKISYNGRLSKRDRTSKQKQKMMEMQSNTILLHAILQDLKTKYSRRRSPKPNSHIDKKNK